LQTHAYLADCGDGVVPPVGVVAAAGDAGCVVPPYLVDLLQATVRDEVEEATERLHGDVVRMHVDMLVHVDTVRVRTARPGRRRHCGILLLLLLHTHT